MTYRLRREGIVVRLIDVARAEANSQLDSRGASIAGRSTPSHDLDCGPERA